MLSLEKNGGGQINNCDFLKKTLGYADRLGRIFRENKGKQIGWAVLPEKNGGTQIDWAVFLEKNGGTQIDWAIFLEKNGGMQIGWADWARFLWTKIAYFSSQTGLPR